jgi:hypothetical protein
MPRASDDKKCDDEALSSDRRDTFRQNGGRPGSPHGRTADLARAATAVAAYRSKGANGKGRRKSAGFAPLTA